jgi:hypothetical protein
MSVNEANEIIYQNLKNKNEEILKNLTQGKNL